MINLLTSLYHDTFTVSIPNSFNSVCIINFRIVLRQDCIKTKHIFLFFLLFTVPETNTQGEDGMYYDNKSIYI